MLDIKDNEIELILTDVMKVGDEDIGIELENIKEAIQIKYPDKATFITSIYNELWALKKLINTEITDLVGDSVSEYSRIEAIYINCTHGDEVCSFDYYSNPNGISANEKAPTLREFYLSIALHLYNKSTNYSRTEEFFATMSYFGMAYEFLGRSREDGCGFYLGFKKGSEVNELKIRKAVSKSGNDKQHASVREDRVIARQWCRDNRHLFSSLDYVADAIVAKNILSENPKFSTVRGYLKNLDKAD